MIEQRGHSVATENVVNFLSHIFERVTTKMNMQKNLVGLILSIRIFRAAGRCVSLRHEHLACSSWSGRFFKEHARKYCIFIKTILAILNNLNVFFFENEQKTGSKTENIIHLTARWIYPSAILAFARHLPTTVLKQKVFHPSILPNRQVRSKPDSENLSGTFHFA